MRRTVHDLTDQPRRLALGYVFAVAGVALMSVGIWMVPGAELINGVSLLYLLIVIAAAQGFGSGPGVAASVLAVLCFDYFFQEPRYTLGANSLTDWLELGMFLVTALVISQLTARTRQSANEASQREREMAALAEASWAVASQVEPRDALDEVLRRLTEVA